MTSSGDDKKKKIVVNYKFPPKRTAREWRQLTNDKLRQYETIASSYLGKKPFGDNNG